ncbi:MAG TPA: Xaa-Pro dipeptidase [Gammaproteobacteria bacterium]|nr:Xaa-Pro dipeptidase [Gammaproteobacteria bacterium]
MSAASTLPSSEDGLLGGLYAEHLEIMAERLAGALESLGLDGLCVFAGPERLVARDDIAYPFRIEPYFKAWLPLTNSIGSVLKLVPGRRPELRYLQADDFWQLPPASPEGFWTNAVDIRIVRSEAELLSGLVEPGRRYAALGDAESAAHSFISVDDAALLARLDFLRAWKTPYEVECIAQASRIATAGHRAAATAFRAGGSEIDLHAAFLKAAGQREAELPYGAIIALGPHAAVLHYQNLDRVRGSSDGVSFLIDAGVEYLGYASDITRTWAEDAEEFEALIDSVEGLQQTLCRELRGGADFVALNARTHELLAQVLADHGIVTCSADEALARGLTRTFLPHGLGHLLGLQVHDAGGRQITPEGARREPPAEHPFLRLTRVVEPGFVLTIEPGLYFIASLLRALGPEDRRRVDWDKIGRLMPFGGIRIEDDVLVEADGIRNLTREAFAGA